MSRYHKNICWQSADGTWSRGFYAVDYYPDDPDDEWGVEFGEDFQWVSGGHATADLAHQSWDGANPGYSESLSYSPDTAEAVLELDVKAAELEERERVNPPTGRYLSGAPIRDYNGPSRLSNPLVLKALAEKFARAAAETRCAQIGYRLDGYANDVTGSLAELRRRRDDYASRAKAAGVIRIDDGSKALLDGLRDLKARDDKRRQERTRWIGYGPTSPVSQQRARQRSDALKELESELAKAEAAAKPRRTARTKVSGAGQGRVQAGVPSSDPISVAQMQVRASVLGDSEPIATRPRTNQSRVPAGSGSRGGQFAAKAHAEADVTLEADS